MKGIKLPVSVKMTNWLVIDTKTYQYWRNEFCENKNHESKNRRNVVLVKIAISCSSKEQYETALTDQTRIKIDSLMMTLQTMVSDVTTRNLNCNCPGNALSDKIERVFVFRISCEDMMDEDKSIIVLWQKWIRVDTLYRQIEKDYCSICYAWLLTNANVCAPCMTTQNTKIVKTMTMTKRRPKTIRNKKHNHHDDDVDFVWFHWYYGSTIKCQNSIRLDMINCVNRNVIVFVLNKITNDDNHVQHDIE